MKQCKTCGSQFEDSAAFCGNCSTSLDAAIDTTRQPVETFPPDQTNTDFSTQAPQQYQPVPPPQQYTPPPQQYPPPPQQYPQNPYQYQQGQQNAPQQPGFHKYHKLGGWLLLVVIGNIIGVVVDVISSFSGIFETIGLFSELSTLQALLPESFTAALVITFIGEIVGLLTIVFTILFLVNLFNRNSNFLRFHQLGLFVAVFYTLFVGIIPNLMLGMLDPDFASNIGVLIGSIVGFFLFALYMSKSIRVRTYMGSDEYMEKAIFAFKDQPPLYPPPGQY